MGASDSDTADDGRAVPIWAMGVLVFVFLIMAALIGGVTLLAAVGANIGSDSGGADTAGNRIDDYRDIRARRRHLR